MCHILVQLTSFATKNFILVHGMGGGAWFWYEVQTLLQHYNFTSTAVDLTSNGINKAIADDVTTVAQYTQPLIDAIAKAPGPVSLTDSRLQQCIQQLTQFKPVSRVRLFINGGFHNANRFSLNCNQNPFRFYLCN